MLLTLAGQHYQGTLIQTSSEFEYVLDLLSKTKIVVVDLETTGLRWFLGDRIAGVALYLPEFNLVFYLPFRHGSGVNLSLDLLSVLLAALSKDNTTYVGYNLKFDLSFMLNEGAMIYNMAEVEDVMYALHLLDENRIHMGKNYKLKEVANEFIDPNASASDEELKRKLSERGMKKGVMSMLPASEVAEYAMFDVLLTWRLREFFYPHLQRWNVWQLYRELNSFMQHSIIRMERNGLYVDRNLITDSIAATQREAEIKLKEIQQEAGYPLNPNSPQQVASWLGLDNARRVTLEELNDPRAEMIIDYKFLTKAVGTFYEPYLYWSSGDGRIHPSLNVTGTVSGRLSSSDPNLQQVPRKPKIDKKTGLAARGYNVKDVFIAPEGYVLAQFDYKAQELRLAAFYSGEPTITETFNSGGDPHQITADRIGDISYTETVEELTGRMIQYPTINEWGKFSGYHDVPERTYKQITKTIKMDRQIGKTLNFGLLYGMGIEKAAAFLKVPYEVAEQLQPAWHALYPAFRQMHYKVTQKAQEWRNPDGTPAIDWKGFRYIRLPDQRVRHFNGDNPPFFSGWNVLIQGTGAIIMRRAIMRLCQTFPNDDQVIPIMTVHDSFIAYVKDNEHRNQTLKQIKDMMEDFPEYNPLMQVECAIGSSWGNVKEIKL